MTGEDAPTERTIKISSGHEVRLPLSTTAAMTGGLFTVSADAAAQLLPSELVPVRVTPARTLVLLLTVEYRRVDRNQFDPYDEVGVFVPAVPDGIGTIRAIRDGYLGGYTWQLPVTTEPARALGECWQFPKTVADITVEDGGGRRRTTLVVDGERVFTLAVGPPRTVPVGLSTRSYTDGDGIVRRIPVGIDGHGGAVPGNSHIDLGTHPWADQLRVLGVGSDGLCGLSFDGEFVVYPPERLE
jgi:hypothetical protein